MRFFVLSLFFAFSSFFLNPVEAGSSKMEIFKDANYLFPSLNFSVSEQIYVRVESDNPGETKRELKLRDNLYREISAFGFSRDGSSPFIYKVSFSAPNSLGYYSLEATIESPGSVDKLVQTIQVGEVPNTQIKTNIRAQTDTRLKVVPTTSSASQTKRKENTATKEAQIKVTPTFQPQASPTPFPIHKPIVLQFFTAIGNIFVVLFKFFFRF